VKPSEILRTLVISLIAGAAGFWVAQKLTSDPGPTDEVTWLIKEFELTTAQAEQVRSLHEAYRPICDAHCAAVMEAQTALADAINPAEKTAAAQALDTLKIRCHVATQAHLEAVAAVMSAEQGQRYLETITPLLSVHEHEAPFGLR